MHRKWKFIRQKQNQFHRGGEICCDWTNYWVINRNLKIFGPCLCWPGLAKCRYAKELDFQLLSHHVYCHPCSETTPFLLVCAPENNVIQPCSDLAFDEFRTIFQITKTFRSVGRKQIQIWTAQNRGNCLASYSIEMFPKYSLDSGRRNRSRNRDSHLCRLERVQHETDDQQQATFTKLIRLGL